MSRDPTLVAALQQDGCWLFVAFKFEFPTKTVRLLDGAGIVTLGSEVYEGSDPDFGSIAAVEPISEDESNTAPEFAIVFNPPDATAVATLANPDMQGSRVTVLVGVVDPATGIAIGTPEVLFLGEIDVPTLRLGEKSRQVEFTVVSVFERLFEVDEGERASDGFHQSIWPGELGLSLVNGTEEKLWWGAKAPAGSTGQTYYPPSGGYNFKLGYDHE